MNTEQPLDDIMVDGVKISQDDIGNELQHHPADTQESALYAAAEALVVRTLLLNRAVQLGLTEQDVSVIDDKEAEQLIEQVIAREVEFPQANEEECQQFYLANTKQFRSPDLLEANHILLAAAPDDLEKRIDQKALAEKLIKQLEGNLDQFGQLAQQYSQCPSKESGGNLGQLSKGSTVPEFEQRVFKLDAGLCNEPIETRYGYHIVWVAHKVEGEVLPFEVVQSQVADYLNHQVYRRALSQYIQVLAGEASIEGFALKAADSPLIQ